MKFTYPAIKVKQTSSDKLLALFSAPCCDINKWAGVPQKKRFGEAESTGFQRELNDKRLKSLVEFFADDNNIIQNPLICASRKTGLGTVNAIFNDGDVGSITIELAELESFSLIDIFSLLVKHIEERVPTLSDKLPSDKTMSDLRLLASENGHDEDVLQGSDPDNGDDDIESVLFEESHIYDFWQEVKGREMLAKELKIDDDSFLGFDKESLVQFLLPISLVDGQHRLNGSILSLEEKLDSDPIKKQIQDLAIAGQSDEKIYEELERAHARSLPVSLMLDPTPEEQVFQFVMINQKATPLKKPLLSTIISTSLSRDEMDNLNERLQRSGLQLTDAQAVTWAARAPESVFAGQVERGMAGVSNDLLKWSVMGSIVSIVRDLKGADLWGVQSDFAKRWKDTWFKDSGIVEKYEQHGFENPYDYWRSLNGPWKGFFSVFWEEIKNRFSSDIEEKKNYWGRPRHSNLFNKISLTILISDFFKYLVTSKSTLDNIEDLPVLMDDWLYDVKTHYFDRDWNLSGVKKDSAGIRKQWADLWIKYRENPSILPQVNSYRIAKKD